eukprot:jgi/Mesvir1/17517/Mv08771-RA.1
MAGKAAQEPTKTAPVADMGADEGTKRKEASSYRVELARSGRSTCTACKKNIAKDEIRLGSGSKVERNHSSLSWRHMACVTAKQVAALEETYASDDYAKVVPGMDELPEDARKAAVDALAKSKSSAEEAAKAEGATKEVEVAEKEAKEEEGGVEASAGAEAAAGGTEAEAKKERAEAPAGEVKEAGGAEEGHANAEEKAKAKAEEHASKPATRGKRKSDSGAHPAVTKENWKAELAKGELSHHNINELKEVLGSLGLPRSGKKEVLLERLKEAANY